MPAIERLNPGDYSHGDLIALRELEAAFASGHDIPYQVAVRGLEAAVRVGDTDVGKYDIPGARDKADKISDLEDKLDEVENEAEVLRRRAKRYRQRLVDLLNMAYDRQSIEGEEIIELIAKVLDRDGDSLSTVDINDAVTFWMDGVPPTMIQMIRGGVGSLPTAMVIHALRSVKETTRRQMVEAAVEPVASRDATNSV